MYSTNILTLYKNVGYYWKVDFKHQNNKEISHIYSIKLD